MFAEVPQGEPELESTSHSTPISLPLNIFEQEICISDNFSSLQDDFCMEATDFEDDGELTETELEASCPWRER